MGNTKYKVIIGILVVLLVAALCFICFLLGKNYKNEEPEKEPETKEVEKKEEEPKEEEPVKEPEKEESKKEETKGKDKILFDATGEEFLDEKALVVLTTDKKVVVNYTNEKGKYITDNVIATDVKETFIVHAGMDDMCWGNERIIIVTKSKTLYLSIDDMMCGNKLVTKDLKGLEGITKVEEKANGTGEYEPADYTVYATDKNGKRINITDRLF